MLTFVERQNEVKRGAVGCHGYCMSGPYALAAAARYPDGIAAAASFYGTWLVSEAEESPHLSLGKVKGELYIACAEHDKLERSGPAQPRERRSVPPKTKGRSVARDNGAHGGRGTEGSNPLSLLPYLKP